MVRERTRAGLCAARARGQRIGRLPKLNHQQRQEVADMVLSGRRTKADAARLFAVSPRTVSRILSEATLAAETVQRDLAPRLTP
jgi:DNA invertase Pin-like site-specific DNA recombinase